MPLQCRLKHVFGKMKIFDQRVDSHFFCHKCILDDCFPWSCCSFV